MEIWTYYAERLEAYFDASGIADDGRKRRVLIAGNHVRRPLRRLCRWLSST